MFLSGIISIEVEAQYDPSFSHYFDMETACNPAAAGKEPKLNFTAAYALDLAGFEHNPRSMYFAVDRPFYFLKSYHGVGLQFLNDQIGLFKHTRVSLQYAYKHGLFGGTLSAAVQVGLLSENFDGSKLDVGDSNDPALSGAASQCSFDRTRYYQRIANRPNLLFDRRIQYKIKKSVSNNKAIGTRAH